MFWFTTINMKTAVVVILVIVMDGDNNVDHVGTENIFRPAANVICFCLV